MRQSTQGFRAPAVTVFGAADNIEIVIPLRNHPRAALQLIGSLRSLILQQVNVVRN